MKPASSGRATPVDLRKSSVLVLADAAAWHSPLRKCAQGSPSRGSGLVSRGVVSGQNKILT